MINRRLFLASAAALALPAPSFALSQSAMLIALLDEAIQRALMDSPQLMSLTGLDTGVNSAARGPWMIGRRPALPRLAAYSRN